MNFSPNWTRELYDHEDRSRRILICFSLEKTNYSDFVFFVQSLAFLNHRPCLRGKHIRRGPSSIASCVAFLSVLNKQQPMRGPDTWHLMSAEKPRRDRLFDKRLYKGCSFTFLESFSYSSNVLLGGNRIMIKIRHNSFVPREKGKDLIQSYDKALIPTQTKMQSDNTKMLPKYWLHSDCGPT